MASLLLDLGVVCGAIIVVLTATTLIAKLPPVRWLWRQLISGPLERFTTGIVREGAREFHETAVAPQIAAIGVKVDELVAQGETSWHKDKSWIHGRLLKVEERQKQLIVGLSSALQTADDGEDVRDLIVGVMKAMLDEDREVIARKAD